MFCLSYDFMVELEQLLGSVSDYIQLVFKWFEVLFIKFKVKVEVFFFFLVLVLFFVFQREVFMLFLEFDIYQKVQIVLQQYFYYKCSFFLEQVYDIFFFVFLEFFVFGWWFLLSLFVLWFLDRLFKEKKKKFLILVGGFVGIEKVVFGIKFSV